MRIRTAVDVLHSQQLLFSSTLSLEQPYMVCFITAQLIGGLTLSAHPLWVRNHDTLSTLFALHMH